MKPKAHPRKFLISGVTMKSSFAIGCELKFKITGVLETTQKTIRLLPSFCNIPKAIAMAHVKLSEIQITDEVCCQCPQVYA